MTCGDRVRIASKKNWHPHCRETMRGTTLGDIGIVLQANAKQAYVSWFSSDLPGGFRSWINVAHIVKEGADIGAA